MKKKERSGTCNTPYRMQKGRHQQHVARQPRQTPCRHEQQAHQRQMTVRFDQQMPPPLQPDRLPLPCLQPILPDSTCIFDCLTCQNLSSSNPHHIPFSTFPFAVSLSIKRDNAGAPFWFSPVRMRSKRYN